MKLFLLILFITICNGIAFGQNNDTWTFFWNKDTTLMGYKDKNNAVTTEPRFRDQVYAKKFDDIIVIAEYNGKNSNYYLTKKGRIVGRDSLYIYDNAPDCESEGYIRFHSSISDKVGMFDRNGAIKIPADYDLLTNVKNGMVVGLKGVQKNEFGEYFGWEGGKQMLLDTNNVVLIDNFKYDHYNLNFFSVVISSEPSTDTIRDIYKGINGQFYSFINYDREFRTWLKSWLVADFTKSKLLECTHNEIQFWDEQNGGESETKGTFVDNNYERIKANLLEINSNNCDFTIFNEGLNWYTYPSDTYKDFFNNCDEVKDWKYPIKNIVINYYPKQNELLQNHFSFLRTDNGYKLISIDIKKDITKK